MSRGLHVEFFKRLAVRIRKTTPKAALDRFCIPTRVSGSRTRCLGATGKPRADASAAARTVREMAFSVSDGTEIATAIGTVGAVGVAVWLGVWRERWRRPVLTIRCEDKPPDTVVVLGAPNPSGRGSNVAYARVRVEAKPGRRAAEHAEVIILGARSVDTDGQVRVVNVESQSLTWSNWPGVTVTRIPAGVWRQLDVVSLLQWQQSYVLVQVSPIPSDARHAVGASRFELLVVATAIDAEPAYYTLTVEHVGTWVGHEWPSGLKLSASPFHMSHGEWPLGPLATTLTLPTSAKPG